MNAAAAEEKKKTDWSNAPATVLYDEGIVKFVQGLARFLSRNRD
jgi:hypothetical protein